MPRDQDRGQSVRVFLSVSGVRAAPRQELEQKLVVAPVGKVDRFAPFDSGRLARELRGVLALLDDDAAPNTGADVGAEAVLPPSGHSALSAPLKHACVLGKT